MSHKKASVPVRLRLFIKTTTAEMAEGKTKMNIDSNNITSKPLTQCDTTLEYMRKKGGIPPIDALSEFGCFSLAQRINDLKKRGHSIVTERTTKQGVFGMVNFAKYHLDDEGVSYE